MAVIEGKQVALPLSLDDMSDRVKESVAYARHHKALKTIATAGAMAQSDGLPVLIRVCKQQRQRSSSTGVESGNPFLPYDEGLCVGDISATHVCLLNKYNVMPRHVLMVAKHEEAQAMPLTPADFHAFCFTIGALGGLGFYNSSAQAGASVNHKHLQLIASPLGDHGDFPFLNILEKYGPVEGIDCVAELPFDNLVVRLPKMATVAERAKSAYQLYLRMVARLGLICDINGALPPYNLLINRDWLWLVPRTTAEVEGIGINALGYAGAILLTDRGQLQTLKRIGVSALLRQAAK
ncbi:ATP adenylyltransferase [Sinobacterium caligoides]|uniref:ATP adenylyltransferase n=1 Tax=Sinobacterium caligoides TaxID=933926 RepID=A0A3N2DP32_9GAMM|nr:phosphorylase [Sinobacterium caligoides]ROS01568.1 ATP adenylyltransferase [Sinobacterium caligoides]